MVQLRVCGVDYPVYVFLYGYYDQSDQMSDDLKRNNGFIPGVKPGKNTKDYLDTIMDRITLPGAFSLRWLLSCPLSLELPV